MTEARKKFYGNVRLSTGQLEVLLFADDQGRVSMQKLRKHYNTICRN